MIKRILLGLGSHEYTSAAIRYSVEMARSQGAKITGVAITDLARLEDVGPIPLGGASAAAELREHRLEQHKELLEQAIGEFESSCQCDQIAHELIRATGDPIELVADLARYQDLCVGALQAMFEGGVVDEPPNELVKLVTSNIRPILAVAEQYRPIQKVLIAYSGSMESAKTMKHFVRFKPWPDVSVKIVHFSSDAAAAQKLLDDAADYCRAYGFDPETEHVNASPVSGLLPLASSWGADLIVTGNSAKSLLRRKIFGETALNAIRHSELPLFLGQ